MPDARGDFLARQQQEAGDRAAVGSGWSGTLLVLPILLDHGNSERVVLIVTFAHPRRR